MRPRSTCLWPERAPRVGLLPRQDSDARRGYRHNGTTPGDAGCLLNSAQPPVYSFIAHPHLEEIRATHASRDTRPRADLNGDDTSRCQGPARHGSWTRDSVWRAGWRHVYCDYPSGSAARRDLSSRGGCCGSPDRTGAANVCARAAGGAVRGCGSLLRSDGPTGRRRAPAQLPGCAFSTRRWATSPVLLQLPFAVRERPVINRPAVDLLAIDEPTDRGQARRVSDLLRAAASGALTLTLTLTLTRALTLTPT